MKSKIYTIDDLCELTGCSRRTIRYYIQEGLLEPPAGRGRGGFYYDSQLNQLLKIRDLQEKGMSLEAIMRFSKSGPSEEAPSLREIYARYKISPGIEIHVRRDVEEASRNKVFKLIKVARSMMKEETTDG